jgi:hypothetical protein
MSSYQFAIGHGEKRRYSTAPMWRNGRRNGLKIVILAISTLCIADQIDTNLPG